MLDRVYVERLEDEAFREFIDTQGLGFVFAEGQDVQLPAQQDQDHRTHKENGGHIQQGVHFYGLYRAHLPVDDGGELRILFGDELQHTQDGAHKTADDGTGQNQHQIGIILQQLRNGSGQNV